MTSVRLKRRRDYRRRHCWLWSSYWSPVYNQMVSRSAILSSTVCFRSCVVLLGFSLFLILVVRIVILVVLHPDHVQRHHLPLIHDGSATRHLHRIPNHLIFTHRINLLTTWIAFRQVIPRCLLFLHDCASTLLRIQFLPQNLERMIREEVSDTPLYRLRDNVRHSLSLHTNSPWYFWTDKECLEMMHQYYSDQDAKFLKSKYEQESGMIKGDICRGLALYELGGLYMDVDLVCRTNVWSLIDPNTTFVTIWEHGSNDFFQAFIGVIPRHAIIQRYLDLFLLYYRGELDLRDQVMNEKKGVVLLRMAHDDIIGQQHKKQPSDLNEMIQLWNETKYDASLFPTIEHPGGKQTSCRFLVTTSDGQVPFWSHIPRSSRHCQASGRNSHMRSNYKNIIREGS